MLGLRPLFGKVAESTPAIPDGKRVPTVPGFAPGTSLRRNAPGFAGKALSSTIALTAFMEPAAAQAMVDLPVLGPLTISPHGALQFTVLAGVIDAAFLTAIGIHKLQSLSVSEN